LVQTGLPYDHAKRGRPIAKQEAKAVPGAVEFAEEAFKKGIRIFYVPTADADITGCTVLEDTRANMAKLGFPYTQNTEAFLLRTNVTNGPRKVHPSRGTRQKYRIIMLLGDDVRDFVSADEANKLATGDAKISEDALKMLGSRWFLIPNPMYGSWLQRISRASDLPTLYQALNATSERHRTAQPNARHPTLNG
jgi:acid phosphatase